MFRRTGRLVPAAFAIAVLAQPGPALAEQGARWSDEFTVEVTRCGSNWSGQVTTEGHLLYTGGGDGGEPSLHVTQWLRAVWTDLQDPSRTYQVVNRSLVREARMTQVSGTVYLVETAEAGAPFTIRTATGRVVFHDSGRLVFRVLMDTQGDADPTNDVFISDEGVSFTGHISSLDEGWWNTTLCDMVNEAAGS